MSGRGRLLAAVVVVLWSAAVSAHPTSTSSVVIDVRGVHAVAVVFKMDALALVTKLEVASGAADPSSSSPDALRDRIRAQQSTFLDRVHLSADHGAVPLAITDIEIESGADASIALSGTMPESARALTWSTDLIYGAYPLVLRAPSRDEVVRWLQGAEASDPLDATQSGQARAIGRGIWLGFTHIVPRGLDHILFVVGLFLLSTRVRQLLVQVSAFTIAHSVTLGLCLYGVVSLPARVVEPLIALSVAYVGIENLVTSRLQPWRVAIVFAFGLLHGLGFAEALASLQVTRADLLSTLVSFNVGVELGQLAVIACASTLLYGVISARRAAWRQPIARVASAGVGVMGLGWMIERVFFL